jgi:hypothetical protein
MQQLREAFPWDQAPRYLLRDRDAIYGSERLVDSIRRECLDHIIVGNERSLGRTLQSFQTLA